MSYGYTMDALVYDEGSETWSLRADYDHTLHTVDIAISDDDIYLDGDLGNNEVGVDTNQTATVTDTDGNLIASGQVYSESYFILTGPGDGTIRVDVIEINGVAVGYLVSAPLAEGVNYGDDEEGGDVVAGEAEEEEEEEAEDDTRTQYSEIDDVPCFCQGTMLATDQGELPVDWIRPGDRILTKDHGYQAVLWAGRSKVSAVDLHRNPDLRPIRIAAHSVKPGVPAQDLQVSPQHRVLLSSAQIELLFGAQEAFASVKSIIDGETISQTNPKASVTYFHIMFEQHEIVLAEGLWTESFFPGKMALSALTARDLRDVHAALGSKIDTMKTARICLKPWEVKLLQPNHEPAALCNQQAA